MKFKNKKEYYEILKEFNINKFNEMKNDRHHGITRYEHTLRVARGTFLITKLLRGNVRVATRAALMHDFFTNEDVNKGKWCKYLVSHPKVALINAKKHFSVSEKEEQIIISHMFPFGIVIPKSKEAWIVVLNDKIASIYEFLLFGIIQGKLLK